MSQRQLPGLEYDPERKRYFPIGSKKKPKVSSTEEINSSMVFDLSSGRILRSRESSLLYQKPEVLTFKSKLCSFPDHRVTNNAVFDAKNRCFVLGSSPESPSIISVVDVAEPGRIRSIYAPFITSPVTEMEYSGNYGLIGASEDVFVVKIGKDPDRYPMEMTCIKQEVASRRFVKNLNIRDVTGDIEGLGYAFSYDNHLVYSLSAAEPSHFSISPVRQSITGVHFWRSSCILTAHSHGLLLLHHGLDQSKKPSGGGEPYRRFQMGRDKDAAKWIQGSRDRHTFATFSFHNHLGLFDVRMKGGCIGAEVQLLQDASASTAIVSDSFLENFYYGVPGRDHAWMRDIRNLSLPALRINLGEKLQNLHMHHRDEKILLELQSR